MTIIGWIFLIVSWTSLTFLTGWCLYKIVTAPFEPDDVDKTS